MYCVYTDRMADPTYVDVGALSASTSPLTVALPGSASAGEKAYAYGIWRSTSGGAWNAPSGAGTWDLEYEVASSVTNLVLSVYSKTLDAADITAGTIGWDVVGTGESTGIGAFIFTVSADDPDTLEFIDPSLADPATGWTTQAGPTTDSTADGLAVSLCGTTDDNAVGLDSGNEQGFTERAGGGSYDSTVGNDFATGLATKAITTGATTITAPTWRQTVSSGNGGNIIGFIIQNGAAPPAAPTNPAAAADSSSQITVTWDNVADETGYRVERSPNGTTGWADVSGNLAADTTSYADTGLTAATQYFYRVYAFNAVGDSDPSTTVNATTDAASGGGNRMGGTGAIRKPPRR